MTGYQNEPVQCKRLSVEEPQSSSSRPNRSHDRTWRHEILKTIFQPFKIPLKRLTKPIAYWFRKQFMRCRNQKVPGRITRGNQRNRFTMLEGFKHNRRPGRQGNLLLRSVTVLYHKSKTWLPQILRASFVPLCPLIKADPLSLFSQRNCSQSPKSSFCGGCFRIDACASICGKNDRRTSQSRGSGPSIRVDHSKPSGCRKKNVGFPIKPHLPRITTCICP